MPAAPPQTRAPGSSLADDAPRPPPAPAPHGGLSPPRPLWLVALHITAVTLLWGVVTAFTYFLPIIARREFAAEPAQIVLITAAPTTLFILSIFWHAWMKRVGITRTIASYWVLTAGPILLLPVLLQVGGHHFAILLFAHIVSCIGGACWPVLHGELLKRTYPDRTRGRMYALITCCATLGGAGFSWLIGHQLADNPASYTIFLPAAALLMGLGCLCMSGVVFFIGAEQTFERSDTSSRNPLSSALDPIVHMRTILREDPIFARYEAAFMTYGIGWMVSYALVPLIVTDRLHLSYDTIAESTHVIFLLVVVLATFPAGLLMDRLGATRTSAIAFAGYIAYPLLLIAATNEKQLAIASVVYGICNAGVSVGWMLGPVSLAPTPAKVPHYVSIHATMVGLRGTIFQGVGVWLYTITHSFTWPLLLGAAGFAWGSWQMWSLHRLMRARQRADAADQGATHPDSQPREDVAGK